MKTKIKFIDKEKRCLFMKRDSDNLIIIFLYKICPIIFLALIISGYLLFTYNKYLPVQEGWFQYYSQLIESGKFPYKDFYVHIQPIFLYLVYGIKKILGPLFIDLRIYGIFERSILGVLIYLYLKRYFNPAYSFIAVVNGVFLYSSFNVELPYSYYQTSLLLSICSLFVFSSALSLKHGNSFKNEILIFITGILSALTFFTKQSSGLLISILYLGIIFVHYYRTSGILISIKKTIIYLSGFCLISSVVLGFIYFNGASDSYYHIVFGSTSSKGSILSILFGFIPRLFVSKFVVILLILIALMISFIAYWGFKYYETRCNKTDTGISKKNLIIISIFTFFTVTAVIIPYIIATSKFQWIIVRLLQLIQSKTVLVTFLALFCLIVIFFMKWIKQPDDKINNYYLLTSLFSFTCMYSHGMSGVLEIHSILPALPFLMVLLFKIFEQIAYGKVLQLILVVFSLMSVFLVVGDRYCRPYYWWGWGEPDVREAKYTTSIPMLHGMYLSPSTKNAYEKIYSMIKDNTKENDELFTFPHIVFFNVISGRMNTNYSPVTYFDVCSDEYALKTVDYLRAAKPRMIIVMNFPEDAWVVHEVIFREGRKSGQRKIVDLIWGMAKSGIYRKIDTVQVSGCYPIDIFLRSN
jgi:hypothetical protein